MAMLNKILAPIDFSELSSAGVLYACRLAKETGAELIVLNVVVLDESNAVDKREMADHQIRLNEFVTDKLAEVGAGVRIRQAVVGGQPYGAIVDCAENERVDLIVMSTHGRTGLSRMLIGSVTDKILRDAPCPVLVVPAQQSQA